MDEVAGGGSINIGNHSGGFANGGNGVGNHAGNGSGNGVGNRSGGGGQEANAVSAVGNNGLNFVF